MAFKITIVESDKKIQDLINKALKKDLDRKMVLAANKMILPIRTLVKSALMSQPEYLELDNGILAAHFGLRNGRNNIDTIINLWVNNITVKSKKSFFRKGQLSTNIQIGVIKSDYSDVLATSASKVVTEDGQILPWLEWLLKFGDKTIVRDFKIKFNPIGKTRSGLAYMAKEPGATWGVPSQFSGTPRNNFTTRALSQIDNGVKKIVMKSIQSSL